jgi:hypothetical protein
MATRTVEVYKRALAAGAVEVLAPSLPKWTENPVRWGRWLVSAAALFGAMSIIQAHFTELFAPPNVIIFAGNAAPANIHTTDPVDIPIVVRNQARLGQDDGGWNHDD